MGNQLLRSGTSVAANYRAVCCARSRAEFLAKLGVVIEEADESAFWLDGAIFNPSRTRVKKVFHSTIKNQNSTIPARKTS
jgi:four helix bundle protein